MKAGNIAYIEMAAKSLNFKQGRKRVRLYPSM